MPTGATPSRLEDEVSLSWARRGRRTLLVVAISRLRDGAVAAEDDVVLERVGGAEGGLAGGAGEGVVVVVAFRRSISAMVFQGLQGVRDEGLGSRHEELARIQQQGAFLQGQLRTSQSSSGQNGPDSQKILHFEVRMMSFLV